MTYCGLCGRPSLRFGLYGVCGVLFFAFWLRNIGLWLCFPALVVQQQAVETRQVALEMNLQALLRREAPVDPAGGVRL